MKNILKTITILSLSFILGCSDSNNETQQAAVCDSLNTEFQQLYNQLIVTNTDEITMDLQIHAYTFEVTSQKNICSIGYQSIPAMATIPYRIEIYDNTTSTLLYAGDNVFSSSVTSYLSVGSIPLVVGNSYTVKRIQTNWGNNIGNTVGRVVTNFSTNFTFPLTFGDFIITGAQFDGNNDDSLIPYIDIVFEQ